ncbi:17.3 kDa class I heat shock protein-like [Curcuma longa]|uniref:17.3 kDa class I heat shock protein-like n=1 Tax=Curcuma longa TaxID=136217 RepID=UPI003D9EB282
MSIVPFGFGSRLGSLFDPFFIDPWEPFEGFPFESRLAFPQSAFAAASGARVDWKETQEAHVFKADLPGLRKEDVRVEVEDGSVLQISGERSREREEKTDSWHRIERSSGKFLRRFRLPANAKADQVKAAMENGVLTVTVPKEAVKKPGMTSIEISG